MNPSPHAALYLRVSKSDGSQSVENQRPEVEQLARARGFDVVTIYEEQASAAKHRPQYEQMLNDARRGKFGVLVVWALDRFGRSMVGNLSDVLELDRISATVVSVRESWLDTGGPVRSLLIAIFSWVAEQDRARLVERTKAGLEQARRRGGEDRAAAAAGRCREGARATGRGQDTPAGRRRAGGRGSDPARGDGEWGDGGGGTLRSIRSRRTRMP
jgi:DNA invertase Pin-like site-specific DNA recombinase